MGNQKKNKDDDWKFLDLMMGNTDFGEVLQMILKKREVQRYLKQNHEDINFDEIPKNEEMFSKLYEVLGDYFRDIAEWKHFASFDNEVPGVDTFGISIHRVLDIFVIQETEMDEQYFFTYYDVIDYLAYNHSSPNIITRTG